MRPNLRLRLLVHGKQGAQSHEDMQRYYASPEWTAKKQEAREAWTELLEYDGCILCGSSQRLQVHHVPDSYKRLFREDPIKDLRVICARCHRKHEGR